MLAGENTCRHEVMLISNVPFLRDLIFTVKFRHNLLMGRLSTASLGSFALAFVQIFDQTFSGMP